METRDMVVRMWRDGLDMEEIAGRLGITTRMVAYYLRIMSIIGFPVCRYEPRRRRGPRNIGAEKTSKLIEMWMRGVPAEDIASTLGVARDTVYRYRRKLRLPRRKREFSTRRIPDETRRMIVDCLRGGLPPRRIAELAKVSLATVYKYARRHGIRLSRGRSFVGTLAIDGLEYLVTEKYMDLRRVLYRLGLIRRRIDYWIGVLETLRSSTTSPHIQDVLEEIIDYLWGEFEDSGRLIDRISEEMGKEIRVGVGDVL